MKRNLFVWAAGLMVLAACSNNDELLNSENLNGKVIVTATVPGDAPDSRVVLTEDNETTSGQPTINVAWEETERFSVIRASENKTYSKNAEGNTFIGDAHTTTVGDYYAFYPANENATVTNAMPYNLSVQTGALDAGKTYMYAKNETDGKNYEFSHLTALVKFTLALPGGTTNVTPTKVVISSEKLQPVGTVDLTGDAVAYTQTANIATSITITPETEQASLSFYAYVNPMTASDSDKNTFVISMDGSDGKYYRGTLETSRSIAANYLYTASVNMISVEKGDYAMADGSFISKDATLTDEQKANVRGIVFWTANQPTIAITTPARLTDDEIMKADFPNCTHGLIVSLKDVSMDTGTGTGTVWQSTSEYIASIASYTAADDPINYILGYQNTKLLKAYNKQCADAYKVLPVSLLETWETTNPAPDNTTGWFIPSEKELTLLCGIDVDDVFDYYSVGIETRNAMNTILASLGTDYADPFGNNCYWSSSQNEGQIDNAFYVDFSDGVINYNNKSLSYYVRAVCAY